VRMERGHSQGRTGKSDARFVRFMKSEVIVGVRIRTPITNVWRLPMTERPLSEAELDAQLDAIEGLLGAYPRAMLALRQVRHERDEFQFRSKTFEQAAGRALKARDDLRAANAALREALEEHECVYDNGDGICRMCRALASSAPETPSKSAQEAP
jgi:hypothetical protein